MFRKTVIAVPARRHTSYWLRLQILSSSHIASQILSRTNVLKCWTPTSLAQRGVNDASKDGKVKTVLQRSPLRLDCPNMTVRVGQTSFDQYE